MYMILRWAINAIGLLAIAYFVPGILVENLYYAMILVLVLGLINAVLGLIIKAITLPINIITLGLSNLVVNSFLFYFVSTFIQGFEVEVWWAAFIGAVLYTVITTFSSWMYKESYMH